MKSHETRTDKQRRRAVPLVFLLSVAVAGCYTGREPEQRLHASFDIPPGWEVLEDRPGYVAIILREPTKDGVGPYVKLELVSGGIFAGSSEDAHDHIKHHQDLRDYNQPIEGWPEPEFKTITLAGKFEVHMDIEPDDYWLTHGDADNLTSSTVFAFSSEGHVVTFYMSDRADLYSEELALIASTTKVSMK